MTISLGQENRTHLKEMKKTVEKALAASIFSIDAIGGGRNSRVYRVETQDAKSYAIKFYFRHPLDQRDRLRVEFMGLKFLWGQGIRSIPQPIMADQQGGFAVYEFIHGEKINSSDVGAGDIDAAVNFLTTLKDIGQKQQRQNLPLASEACFSNQALVENIQSRLNRLSAVEPKEEEYAALHKFLQDIFVPLFYRLIDESQADLKRLGMTFDQELAPTERTLSPSDFGFHNALRKADGQIIFLDFEYFGWDDPVKMISDFLLHPAMNLSENSKLRFKKEMYQAFAQYPNLSKRVKIFYPFWGLKWTLILLNEFVPQDILRRGFAQGSAIERPQLLQQQLSKAQKMFATVQEYYASANNS